MMSHEDFFTGMLMTKVNPSPFCHTFHFRRSVHHDKQTCRKHLGVLRWNAHLQLDRKNSMLPMQRFPTHEEFQWSSCYTAQNNCEMFDLIRLQLVLQMFICPSDLFFLSVSWRILKSFDESNPHIIAWKYQRGVPDQWYPSRFTRWRPQGPIPKHSLGKHNSKCRIIW